ncbi:hypothetical protein ES703_99062 [subsurface metagenome]
MTDIIRPWPYAAKPYIQFEFKVDRVIFWLTFQYPMDTSVVPAAILFTAKIDGVDKGLSVVNWKSAYTLNMQVQPFAAHPTRVLLSYAGPSEDLRTTWQKQWEPWNVILCHDVPLDWEHVLDVDVNNAIVTIHGMLAFSAITLTAGLGQSPSVSKINIIWLDCSGGDIVIRRFVNGVDGQRLFIARLDECPNDTVIVHQGAPPGQLINLHAGFDETLTNEFGGWTLLCNGSEWFDLSHAWHG